MNKLKQYIQDNGIDSECRKHSLVFQRHYICNKLYSEGMTLKQIGTVVNRHWTTVRQSVNKHNDLKDDKFYQLQIQKVKTKFEYEM